MWLVKSQVKHVLKASVISIILVFGYHICKCQSIKRPTSGRFFYNKYKSFTIQPGDTLVYSQTGNEKKLETFLVVKQFNERRAYDILSDDSSQGNRVEINGIQVLNGLPCYFNNPDPKMLLNNGCLWLSNKNHRELRTARYTLLNAGNGLEEFVVIKNSTIKVNINDVPHMFIVFMVSNKNAQKPIKFDVLADTNNPLIVRVHDKNALTLKEVR